MMDEVDRFGLGRFDLDHSIWIVVIWILLHFLSPVFCRFLAVLNRKKSYILFFRNASV